MQVTLEKGLNGLALTCLGLLILQVSISFLPDVIILKYITATRLILLLGLFSIALLYIIKEQKSDVAHTIKESKNLFILVAILLFWYAVSALFSTSSMSFSIFRLQLEEILAFLFVVLLVRDEENLGSVMFIFLMAVSVVALHSVKQFIDHDNTNFFLVQQGGWRAIESLAIPENSIVRVSGYFNNPNILSTYLILLMPIVSILIKRPNISNWLVGMLVSIAGIALLLTFSRGAAIALVIALSITFWRKKRYLMYGTALVIFGFLASPFSTGRLSEAFSRLNAWSIAAGIITERPLFGVGPGNFHDFVVQETSANFWHAHNLFLHVSAEAGLIAGIVLLGILAFAIRWALDLSRVDGPGRPIGLALSVSFIAFSIYSITDNAYNITPISYTFWLLLGLLVATRNMFKELAARTNK